MDKELEKKLIKILNSEKLEEELYKLSLQEKIQVLKSNNAIWRMIRGKLPKDYMLVNEEESLYLYENYQKEEFDILQYATTERISYNEKLNRVSFVPDNKKYEDSEYNIARFVRKLSNTGNYNKNHFKQIK